MQSQRHPRYPFISLDPGAIVDGRYRIEAEIGSGGMCVVYRATQLDLDRPVALKMPLPRLRYDTKALARFFNEAAATAQLHHPNIVEVYAVGNVNGLPYIAMELLEGLSLSAYIAGQPDRHLTDEQTLPLVLQLCDALQYAHEAGVIHRDVKPSNIMLVGHNRDAVKIVDFGIARILEVPGTPSGNLTASGELLGSVSYMSPEQCRSQPVDNRSDLYSLGCVIYEMLSGQPPFVGATPYSVIMKQSTADLELPKVVADSRFRRALTKLLEKDPDRRPASAAAVKDLLTAPKSQARGLPLKSLCLGFACCLLVALPGLKLGESLVQRQQAADDSQILRQISDAIDAADKFPEESTGSYGRLEKCDFAAAKLASITTHKRQVLKLWARLASAYPCRYAAGKKVDAVEKARAMITKDPTLAANEDHIQPELFFCAAQAYERLGQPERAMDNYSRCKSWLQAHDTISQRDDWFWLNFKLGNLLFQSRDWQSAAACYSEVLSPRLKHMQNEINFNARRESSDKLIRCYLNLGRHSEAAQAYAVQARLLIRDGNYPAALNSINSAITLDAEPSLRQQRAAIKDMIATERGQHSRK